MEGKICSSCSELKPTSEFYNRKDRASGKMSQCKLCAHATTRRFRKTNPQAVKEISGRWYNQNIEAARAASRRWQKKNPEKVRAAKRSWRLKRYGLTPQAFAELFATQEGKCGVCRRGVPTKQGWQVDHNHATGTVRGILCSPCNTGIGLLGDTLYGIELAARYLRGSSGKT